MKKPRKPRPKSKPHRHRPAPLVHAHRPPLHREPAGLFDAYLRSATHLWSATSKNAAALRTTLGDFAQSAVHTLEQAPTHTRAKFRSRAAAVAIPYSRDERQLLALLFLPFLLVASVMVAHQSMRTLHTYINIVEHPDQQLSPIASRTAPTLPRSEPTTVLAQQSVPAEAAPLAKAAPDLSPTNAKLAVLDASAPTRAADAVAASDIPAADDTRQTLAPAASALETPTANTTLALLAPSPGTLSRLPPSGADDIESFEADETGNPIRPGICRVDQTRRSQPPLLASAETDPRSMDDEQFGALLAKAAEQQIGGFVIYDDTYRTISYPMGDVRALFGVCTDVVVRAYRALGLDLQTLVHEARAGSGDKNIDQRRTEVLRRFFAKAGQTLPITSFAEDYKPGDIVTYYRPQNQRTRAHIAIVSSVYAPSGRPMIVHNRGWGPQLEDALFVDEITGHYRYRGPAAVRSASTSPRHDAPHATGSIVQPASFASDAPPKSGARF